MNKVFIISIIFLLTQITSFANSINPALYQSMQRNSYRNNNYSRFSTYRPVPYWQAQSNYATRGRVYQNYSDYNNYQTRYNQIRSYK